MIFNIFKIIKKRKKRKRLHFILDISLSIIILLLLVVIFTFNVYRFPVSEPEIVVPEPPEEIEIEDPFEFEISFSPKIIFSQNYTSIDISYKNKSEEEIDQVRIDFQVLSPGFNLANLRSDLLPENAEIVNNILVLENIESNYQNQFSLKASFSLPADPLLRQLNWRAVADISYLQEEFKQEYSLDNLRFYSDTSVSAKAYYHSARGDQLGIGPIPPIASIPTSYWVFFEVENLGNDLNDFVISARLPDHAQLGDRKSLLAGSYSYDQENNRLIWQVPLIDKSGGSYLAGFEITIVPSQDDIGSVLNIVENISYQFQDSYYRRSDNLADIDTNLRADFINQGQGTVRE